MTGLHGFRTIVTVLLAVMGAAVLSPEGRDAHAQGALAPRTGIPASSVPAQLREVGFDQQLDQRVPLDIPLADEHGTIRPLADFFGSKPVVLALVYFDCPMLCTQVLNSLVSTLGVLSSSVGRDFDVLAVSFDPREQPALAAAKKATYLERYGRPESTGGWHFLTGQPASIDRLSRAVGFRYVWDEPSRQFAHPAGIMVLTPDGRMSRYLFGLDYGPRDLRLALVEASAGRIGNPADHILLYCYRYDPATGRYGLVVMRALRLAALATVVALGALIAVLSRRSGKEPGATALS